MDSTTHEEIRTELVRICEQLDALDDLDFAGRVELREQRAALKHRLAELQPTDLDRSAMQRELQGLRANYEAIVANRPNVAAMNDGGQGGAGMAENQRMAWDYDEGTGRRVIHDRIAELERRLSPPSG